MSTSELTLAERKDLSVSERANAIIEQAKKCTERGEGRGKCHVFLDGSLLCECKTVNLERERMK